jgi:diamine N-acetyltransferase
MPTICLRDVTMDNFRACVKLSVRDEQRDFVADNTWSLAQAYVNRRLHPYAIYRGDVFGREITPDDAMVGFVMFQVWDEIGFIMRLMVGAEHQRQGYGRAAMVEVIRRLKATTQVDRIATSVIPSNEAALQLYLSLGFEPFDEKGGELYLRLPWGRDARE